mmetsp:Transcript_7484/g.21320  ORF Transcript_7484/g.21320 Transcript_7484/m.21320 type:complete len:101 (+) Transcript_7484:123-425(+)
MNRLSLFFICLCGWLLSTAGASAHAQRKKARSRPASASAALSSMTKHASKEHVLMQIYAETTPGAQKLKVTKKRQRDCAKGSEAEGDDGACMAPSEVPAN